MTILVWDQVGERRYETGIDRGVLYKGATIVPWNGLTSVTENSNREITPHFLDGMKYLDRQVIGPYTGKLKAFTYPDELEELLGTAEYSPGARVHGQRAQAFSLSYRTRIGNDLEATDYGYKIHVVYNVLATPSDISMETTSDVPAPALFEWDLAGMPYRLTDYRPFSHISFDSRRISESGLAAIEAKLYGTDLVNPELPEPEVLLDLAAS